MEMNSIGMGMGTNMNPGMNNAPNFDLGGNNMNQNRTPTFSIYL